MAGNCARYSILIVDDKELDRNGVCYLIQRMDWISTRFRRLPARKRWKSCAACPYIFC